MDDAVPEFPFYVEHLDVWVHLDPELDLPGESGGEGGESVIWLREYDERVLFHEMLHVAFARDREVRAALGYEGEERFVRTVTRCMYAMGWRWRKTDRDIAVAEREVSRTAEIADALRRELGKPLGYIPEGTRLYG